MRATLAALFLGAALAPAEAGGGPPAAPEAVRTATPALAAYTDGVIAELWARDDIAPRDRHVATLVALITAGHADALPAAMGAALDAGIAPAEIAEIVTHLAFYTGWPNSVATALIAEDVFAARGVVSGQVATPEIALMPVDAEAERVAAERVVGMMGGPAPALADYTNRVLFGEVWRRPTLSPRDRSLVTISALIATGNKDQFRSHLGRALDNGLTEAEASGVITHLAFYTGWPNGVSAAGVAEAVFAARAD